tara:strand:+ start:562 stop:690 length:129 start_codon:yes stop_codon:yes gene_type:complete
MSTYLIALSMNELIVLANDYGIDVGEPSSDKTQNFEVNTTRG